MRGLIGVLGAGTWWRVDVGIRGITEHWSWSCVSRVDIWSKAHLCLLMGPERKFQFLFSINTPIALVVAISRMTESLYSLQMPWGIKAVYLLSLGIFVPGWRDGGAGGQMGRGSWWTSSARTMTWWPSARRATMPGTLSRCRSIHNLHRHFTTPLLTMSRLV